MNPTWFADGLFWAFAIVAVVSAWLVFRVDSMVRAAFWLLGSFLGVAAMVLMLRAEFLGLVLALMMAGEMAIMAVFMVMFMMNPAGLNPMTMVHQHRTAAAAGLAAFVGLASVGLLVPFPHREATHTAQATAALGHELLGDSMLIFESAGVALLATMVGAVALASPRGRFGEAWADSREPALDPETREPEADSAGREIARGET